MSQNPTARIRSPFRFGPALWAAACGAALALAACEDRVAGTSVGTGNPTEIEVAFKDSAGAPVALTGSLQVYAATQIPVPGFRPQPLVSVDVKDATTASLRAEDLAGLPDSLWAAGSAKDGIYDFNLVIAGQTQGAILQGYSFRKSSARFLLGDESVDGTGTGGLATVEGKVAPFDTLSGNVDTAGFNVKWDYHLFVYGTGFSSKIEKGRFSLAGMPRGRYAGNIVLVPSSQGGSSIPDSLNVFDLVGTLDPSGRPHSLGTLHDVVPTPPSFQP